MDPQTFREQALSVGLPAYGDPVTPERGPLVGWFIAVMFVLALIYFVARSKSTSTADHSPRSIREAGRTPVYTTPRSAPAESSVGREMPFAAPGVEGRLFSYGGPRLRGGVEHVGPYAVMDVGSPVCPHDVTELSR